MTSIGNTTALLAIGIAFQINNKDKSVIMELVKVVSKLLFEFSFGMQIMITAVYWIAIHAQLMAKFKELGERQDFVVFNYIVHILPLASIFFNVTFTNIRFKYSHMIFTAFMCVIFFIANYFGVMHFNNGEPLYPFFPWATDLEGSIINAFVLMILACLVYLATCLFVNKGLRQPVIS